ncbi:hypothetical protein SA58113_p20057 (plasmid) [Staphylococcus argenteus]|nr:hypothetical protein SA58113_p20057 [Staphylococcus argenteus]
MKRTYQPLLFSEYKGVYLFYMEMQNFNHLNNAILYRRFINGEIDTMYRTLYQLFIDFIKYFGEQTDEKDVCQLLLELQRLNLSDEVSKYIQMICRENQIYEVLNAINAGTYEVITRKNNIYDKGIPIYDDEERIVMKLLNFFLDVLKDPKDVTTYDIDFILTGILEGTQYVSTERFVQKIFNSIALYPNECLSTHFFNSIIVRYYSGEHLEIIRDGIKSVHSIEL